MVTLPGTAAVCRAHRLRGVPAIRFDPWVGKIPWRKKLQYPCLGNPIQRSLVDYTPWGHKESDTSEQLSMHTHTWHVHTCSRTR